MSRHLADSNSEKNITIKYTQKINNDMLLCKNESLPRIEARVLLRVVVHHHLQAQVHDDQVVQQVVDLRVQVLLHDDLLQVDDEIIQVKTDGKVDEITIRTMYHQDDLL